MFFIISIFDVCKKSRRLESSAESTMKEGNAEGLNP